MTGFKNINFKVHFWITLFIYLFIYVANIEYSGFYYTYGAKRRISYPIHHKENESMSIKNEILHFRMLLYMMYVIQIILYKITIFDMNISYEGFFIVSNI